MSKEKQIEEMARELNTATFGVNVHTLADHLKPETINKVAEYLYNAGYRKQVWISVEERLPTVEEQGRGLVGIVNGYNGKIRFTDARVFLNYDYNYNEWYSEDYDIQNCKIECWMPLPEPPKMKGGAE